jgi:hypothetical protein
MSDHLAGLPVERVAAWYRRLAGAIGGRRVSDGVAADGQAITREPLAAVFLRHYLDNRQRGSTFAFDPPGYLRQDARVITALQFHRAVFLTEQRARVASGEIWAGVLPRIQGRSGFQRWDLSGPLSMNYESLVEIGSGLVDIARIQTRGTDQERDLFTSLRGFQLRSQVAVLGQRQSGGRVRVTFQRWTARARDTYDFDFSEHLTVPNPDYQSTASDAVRPQDETLTVYHRNAERLERANLAAPFVAESREWTVSDARLTSPADVDPGRQL